MNTLKIKSILFCITYIFAFSLKAQKLTVNVNEPTVELSPYLYGLFFEDINYGADGGLYAELVQNRSFEYFPVRGTINSKGHLLEPMYAWEKTTVGNPKGNVYVTRSIPLNTNNQNNLEIDILSNDGFLGAANVGYDGILLKKGEKYNLSFFMLHQKHRAEKYTKHMVKVILENEAGKVIDSIEYQSSSLIEDWTKFEHVFTPTESTSKGRLVVLAHGKSIVKFDVVSLMPQNTYNNRKNGLRSDLVTALKELNPKFLRFPGGCILHGWGLDNIVNWKHTLGPIEERKPNWNRWGYHQTYGLGYFEYFQLCEDLGMTPLPVVPVGVSCSFWKFECVPMDHLHETIQDALDLVEFANGSVSTKWGKVRADMGHPEPFNLKYISLGNEEGDTKEIRERMPLFVKAFKEKYPGIRLIGTSGLTPDIPLYQSMADLKVWSSDEHYYMSPEWFITNQDRFDKWDRSKPKVFLGEYASQGNTLYNAVSEAIYLTGVERNGDLVEMTCYAPLFARIGNTQWKTDLIYFDNETVVKTANYYVQQMFGQNKGDVYLKNTQEQWPGKELAVSSTFDNATGEVIFKIANATGKEINLNVVLSGAKKINSKAQLIMLTGDKAAENNMDNINKIVPVVSTIKASKDMTVNLPAYSVQVLRIRTK